MYVNSLNDIPGFENPIGSAATPLSACIKLLQDGSYVWIPRGGTAQYPARGQNIGTTSEVWQTLSNGQWYNIGGGCTPIALNPTTLVKPIAPCIIVYGTGYAYISGIGSPNGQTRYTARGTNVGTSNESWEALINGVWQKVVCVPMGGSGTQTVGSDINIPGSGGGILIGTGTGNVFTDKYACLVLRNGKLYYNNSGEISLVIVDVNNRLRTYQTQRAGNLENDEVLITDPGTSNEIVYIFHLGQWNYLVKCNSSVTTEAEKKTMNPGAYTTDTISIPGSGTNPNIGVITNPGSIYLPNTGSNPNVGTVTNPGSTPGTYIEPNTGTGTNTQTETAPCPKIQITTAPWHGRFVDTDGTEYPADSHVVTGSTDFTSSASASAGDWHVYINGVWVKLVNCEIPKAKTTVNLPPCIQIVLGKFYFIQKPIELQQTQSFTSPISASPTSQGQSFIASPANPVNGFLTKTYSDVPMIEMKPSGGTLPIPNQGLFAGLQLNDGLSEIPMFGQAGTIDGVISANVPMTSSTNLDTIITPTDQMIDARVVNQGTSSEKWYGLIDGSWLEIINCQIVKKAVQITPEPPKENLPPCIQNINGKYYYSLQGSLYDARKVPLVGGSVAEKWYGLIDGSWLEIINCQIVKKAVQITPEPPKENLPPCIQNINGKYYYSLQGSLYDARKVTPVGGSVAEKWYALVDGYWQEINSNCQVIKPVVIDQKQDNVITPVQPNIQPSPVYPNVQPNIQPSPIYPNVQPNIQPESDCDCEVKKLSMPKMVIYDYPKPDNCRNEFY